MKKKILTLILIGASQCLFGQTPRQIENLEAFNRLYGYVKYFHPSDEAAGLDWNAFAFYGSKKVEQCNNSSELQSTLIDLFSPIAPTLQISGSSEPTTFSRNTLTPPETSDYKTISWQHLGLALGERGTIYKSSRLNRKSAQVEGAFSTILSSVSIDEYKNKEFTLTAKVKLSEGPGSGHLWARVDRPNGQTGFFENMMARPITANEWQQYEIKGIVDSDGVALAFGCFLMSRGTLFVDDLRLMVREGVEWKIIYSNSFEADNSNEVPRSINNSNTPGYRTVVTERESNEGAKSILIQGMKDGQDNGLIFGRYCHVGEHIKKEIGSGLTVIMPLAVYGNENSTYPKADTTKLSALENHFKNVSTANTTDLHVRIGNLIITWNIFQHFYPYFKETKTDWHEAFRSAVKDSYTDKTEYDFVKTMRKFTAKLKDGHVRVNSPSTEGNEDFILPIKWEWVENQLVVTDILKDKLPLKAGDIVTAIDEQSPQKYFENVYSQISAATTGWLKYRAQLVSLQGSENSQVTVSISNEQGIKKQVLLVRDVPGRKYYEHLKNKNDEPLRKLSDDIYYINMGVASMEQIKSKMADLQNSKAVICDLRGYPNSNHEFIGHLLKSSDTSKKWMRIPKIIYPDQENITGYQEMGWSLTPLKPHLSAKIFFIIDGQAISYAESYLSFIEHYKLATIIGQPSAGTNGNVNPFTLRGFIQISWTGMKVVKHDGSQHHGVGILPTVYLTKTIKGVREQKDEFLAKAIEVASKVD